MTAISPRQTAGAFAEPRISRPARGRPFGAIGRFFAAIAADVREYGRRQRVVSELSRLSDRELADIGLTRTDIGQVFTSEFGARRKAERRGC
jgi:uncharacterized protein YjiS (DUF1127 family)